VRDRALIWLVAQVTGGTGARGLGCEMAAPPEGGLLAPHPGARNTWGSRPSSAPYVTVEDEPYVTARNRIHGEDSPCFLDLYLLPEPFLGRHDAPLVALSAHPGRAGEDAQAYRRLGAADRLAEVATDRGTRFGWLADDVRAPPAGRWWRRCLGGRCRDGYGFGELADCDLAVEFHRYRSQAVVSATDNTAFAAVRVLPGRPGGQSRCRNRGDTSGPGMARSDTTARVLRAARLHEISADGITRQRKP
jgi:hypothetical protein